MDQWIPVMPVKLDPDEAGGDMSVLRKQKVPLESTKVVLFSERTPEELREISQACGADGFIEKSTGQRGFLRDVAKWLGGSG